MTSSVGLGDEPGAAGAETGSLTDSGTESTSERPTESTSSYTVAPVAIVNVNGRLTSHRAVDEDGEPKPANTEERVGFNSVMLSVIGVLTRVLTLGTHFLIAREFGNSPAADAFYATEIFADLFVVLIGSGLSMTAIPVYLRLRSSATGDTSDPNNFLFSLVVIVTGVFAVVGALSFVLAPQIAFVLAPGVSASSSEIIADILRAMVLMLLFLGADAGLRALFNANRIFAAPELARIGYNVVVIGSIVLFAPRHGPIAIAWGLVIGVAVMVAVEFAWAWARGLLSEVRFSFGGDCSRALRRLPSNMVILGYPLVVMMADRSAASNLEVGTVAALGYGSRIVMLAVGLIVLPFATATFPALSDLAAVNDRRGFGDRLGGSLQTVLVLTFPPAAMAMVARFDIVALLFEGGAFSEDSVARTGQVVAAYALGLPGFGVIFFVRNAFFAVGRSGRLAGLSLVSLAVGTAVNHEVVDRWGMVGVTIATAAVVTVTAAISVWVFSLDDSAIVDWGRIRSQVFRAGIATVVLAGSMAYVSQLFPIDMLGGGRLGIVAKWLVLTPVAGVVYVGVAALLGVAEARVAVGHVAPLVGGSRAFGLIRRLGSSGAVRAVGARVSVEALVIAGGLLVALAVGITLTPAVSSTGELGPYLLGAAVLAGPGLALLGRRAGYDAAVLLALVVFAVVFIEPAPVDGLLAVLIPVGILTGRLDRSRLEPGSAVVAAVVAMLTIHLVSTAGATDPITSLRYTIITVYCVSIMFFVRAYVNDRRDVDRLVAGYLIGAAVAMAAVLGALVGVVPEGVALEFDRARGFTEDANVFGPFLVAAIFLALDRLRRSDTNPRIKLLLAASMLLNVVGVLLSFSRAAWGNLVLTALLYAVLAGRTFTARERRRAVLALVAGSVVLVVTLVAFGQIDFLLERATLLQSYDSTRFDAQRTGVRLGFNNVIGIGPGMTDVGELFAPHNTYIRAFAETGIVGLVALFGLLGAVVAPVLRRVRISTPHLGMSSPMLVAVVVGQLANALLIDTLHWRHFWFLLGLLWVQHHRSRPGPGPTDDDVPGRVPVAA